tara:strand:- start:606 stop:1556 length:951 start_codon:yes stop_codon:yes gene_type:complete
MINELVIKYKDKIEEELNSVYKQGPKLLLEPINHVFSGKGKRFRPLLTLFTAKTLEYDVDKALDAAISIEILHNFTLVHDDIMDKDKLRHGKETVNVKWDNDIALLSGDAMLALAMQKLNSYSGNHLIFPTFVNGLLAVCEGQALDKEFENKSKINISDYMNMIDLKTGYLIGLSAELGSVVADVKEEESALFREFGRRIGRAFQIQDDILEIFSDSKTMGKSLESDLVLGKKTFLMVNAEEQNSGFIDEVNKLISKNYSKGIIKIRKMFLDNGSYDAAKKLINENIKHANDILKSLPYDTQYLQYFSDLIGTRKF